MMNYRDMPSPIGRLRLVGDAQGLAQILFEAEQHSAAHAEKARQWHYNAHAFGAAVRQLEAYFAGRGRSFDIPLSPVGTAFQKQVWHALQTIPYGHTASYAHIAEHIGNPRAVRAVGAANGRNPLPIVVPCHRVIGADGSLTGYAGGLSIKQQLLELEGALSQQRLMV